MSPRPLSTVRLFQWNPFVHPAYLPLYSMFMDVAVTTLRAELATWIERARAGEEVVVTDRGVPVARILSVDAAPMVERLTRQGVLSKPRRPERPTARSTPRVHAQGSVSDLVGEQRR